MAAEAPDFERAIELRNVLKKVLPGYPKPLFRGLHPTGTTRDLEWLLEKLNATVRRSSDLSPREGARVSRLFLTLYVALRNLRYNSGAWRVHWNDQPCQVGWVYGGLGLL